MTNGIELKNEFKLGQILRQIIDKGNQIPSFLYCNWGVREVRHQFRNIKLVCTNNRALSYHR